MAFARISSLDRLLACAGSEFLGGTDEKSEGARVAADWGTMVHHWKETGEIVAVNERTNLPPLFEKKLREGGVRREQWWPEDMVHELALAVDPSTEGKGYYRSLGRGDRGAKDKWKTDHSDRFVTGTADGYAWMFDRLWVDDLKTGRDVTFEQHEQQLKGYALGVARVLEYRGPVHATVTWWPRYPVVSQPQRFGRVIEQDELLAFERGLVTLRNEILRYREAKEKVMATEVHLAGGPQCNWCPSRDECPSRAESEW